MAKPGSTTTNRILPYGELSPADFERLCLRLIEREGYLRAEALGLAGSEQGRDLIAYRAAGTGEQLWYFQCKRYHTISTRPLIREIEKYNELVKADPTKRPDGVVFITNATISANAREQVRAFCSAYSYECEFWARTEFDMRVKKYPDIVAEFFDVTLPPPLRRDKISIQRLPFDELSSADFERLCLWLVEREGYLCPEHLGDAGTSSDRDVVAHRVTDRGEQLWYFQCKRYKSISAAPLIEVVEKYNYLVKADPTKKPFGIVFVTNATISANARDKVRAFCSRYGYECEFWARTELFALVMKYPDIVAEFFNILLPPPLPSDKISIARLPVSGPDLFGRDSELKLLDDAWANPNINIIAFVAWGGVGKTALVSHWLRQRMSPDNYRGAERVYWWSFYSQGTSEQATSADEFIYAALRYFGDTDPTAGTPWDKGERLARIIRQTRVLLILDGLEPLQHPPGAQWGLLKDAALQSLLLELAAHQPGLCVISTRERVSDLVEFEHSTVVQHDLEHLSPQAGAQILRALNVKGDDEELEEAARAFNGHAFSLTLMGSYLDEVLHGDIRRRKEIENLFEEIHHGDKAQKMIAAYEKWLGEGVELAVLRLMGLFDRPADAAIIAALRAAPAIPGLTEALQSLSNVKWQEALANLRRIKLLGAESINERDILDAHPLVREYFKLELRRERPDAWREANYRLYDHLKRTAKDLPDTTEEMSPLLAAISHGCAAGMYQEACDIYHERVHRGNESFITKTLGAYGADLAVLSNFFELPWEQPVAELSEASKAFVLAQAGFGLQALGLLNEASQAMQPALKISTGSKDWENASEAASNLSDLYLTIGDLPQALDLAQKGAGFATRGRSGLQLMINGPVLAGAQHQMGLAEDAVNAFRQADGLQQPAQPAFPNHNSRKGFRYCDLLLDQGQAQEVKDRAVRMLETARLHNWLLDIALHDLLMGSVRLREAHQPGAGDFKDAAEFLQRAVDGLRQAGRMDYLPRGLLERAALHRITGDFARAERDLAEVQRIATRSGMGLYLTDYHLESARLYLVQGNPDLVRKHLETAEAMVERLGYHRRDSDLAELESASGDADRFELEAREKIASSDFEGAKQRLLDSIAADPSRKIRILDEFAFAFCSVDGLGPGLQSTREITDAFSWRCRLWNVIAARNHFSYGEPEESEGEKGSQAVDSPAGPRPEDVSKKKLKKVPVAENEMTPESKGEKLEQAVERLFSTFFRLSDEVVSKIRQQKRGTQFGFDLSIECEVNSEQLIRAHVECKNYQEHITPAEVSEKLLSEEKNPPVIEQWILISPNSDPSNELNRILEKEQRNPWLPFGVQVWSPESQVGEFFGLEPDIYDEFFKPGTKGEVVPHPRTWDEVKRKEVIKRWRSKLEPTLRQPKGWPEYLRDPNKLCTPPEDAENLSSVYENYVPMRCRNMAGGLLEKPLSIYVNEWLEQQDKPVLFLLGEFGDGKSCFTYILSRDLVTEWLRNRRKGWIPLRLTLRKFPGDAREFLRQRLEEFTAEVGGWLELGKDFRRLVILDGFDEMSVRLDPSAMTSNIRDLLACVKEFEGCKLLITSRTHFFENRQDAQRLLSRLNNPPVYRLAPIGRREVTRHLISAVSDESGKQILPRIQQMSDPIGLASKPLFLEMLKEVLSSPNLPNDLGVLDLYELYIDRALSRKAELLDDPDYYTPPQTIRDNLRKILGQIAEELQRTGEGFVSLSKYQVKDTRPFAELLWQLSGSAELDKDARSRISARSLLGRVMHEEVKDELPVDFCHRSMREYFVALRLCDSVEAGEEQGIHFLKEVPLNHEIIHFAAEHWRKHSPPFIKDRLLALIRAAKLGQSPGRLGGNALTLLYRLDPELPRDFDWTEKNFDGVDLEEANLSEMNFRGCSFVNANLSNVNFEGANFEDCDLTGVRLEETKPIVSLVASPTEAKICALYGDGVLREWHVQPGSKATWKVLTSLPPEPSSVLGYHESGQMWVHTQQDWVFLDQQGASWHNQGKFPIKETIRAIWSKGDLLAFTMEDEYGDINLFLMNLAELTLLYKKRSKSLRWCAALGNEALVLSDAEVGFRVVSTNGNSSDSEIILQSPEPTCLGIWPCGYGNYLVAGGTGDGTVRVWHLDLNANPRSEHKILEGAAHNGPVTAVAFMDDTCVASGGTDRTIVLNSVDDSNAAVTAKTQRRLQLTLRCKDMKIRGLKGPAEYGMLSRLIAALPEN